MKPTKRPKKFVGHDTAQNNHLVDIDTEMTRIHELTTTFLTTEGVSSDAITKGDVRLPTILYMTYWFHRLRNNQEEQSRVHVDCVEYIGTSVADAGPLVDRLFSNQVLADAAKEYVKSFLVPKKMVDLFITRDLSNGDKSKEVLCMNRTYYPFGVALPGGAIRDEDEDNAFGLPEHVFAALRVAGERVLGLTPDRIQYLLKTDKRGNAYFLVRSEEALPAIRLYSADEGGYHYHENIKSVLRPADPRHIVDTVCFKCELEGEPLNGFVWSKVSDIMSPKLLEGGFAFGHHREIVAHMSSQTSVAKERELKEREFIRSIIKQPLESYYALRERFEKEGNSFNVSFHELFPVVDRFLTELFKDDINELCSTLPILAGVRDKVVISLRHVSLKNRVFCPYAPTLRAISESIAFFDLVARQKRKFYDSMPKDEIVEHNPRTTPNASYHMYRYKYRFDQLMSMIPNEMIIPTFESLSATDLMRIRGVPIQFIGLSMDFLYVDEFEQSPEEFFMHDCNHSWRMIMEDRNATQTSGKTRDEYIQESNAFIREYLDLIKIAPTDTEEQREMKKLKKIILFEIVHEDARPFLKDVVCEYIQQKEGDSVPFEVPRIDQKTGYMDVVDTLDTGISTLSYVRNKLQHGFYDQIDAQLPQIVGPAYRTAEWIARAAYEMLVDLNAVPSPIAERDVNGRVSYEWLLRRTCAVGPDNVHGTEKVDPAVAKFGDGAEKLNPKRYQAGENG